jgi:O-antigen/teichoic acid export membrane protein
MTLKPLIQKVRAKLATRPPRAIAMFFITSLAARGLGILCQMMQVPIVMKALGTEAFGLWMAMMSLTYLVTFADFGMGIGVQNRLAEAFAHNAREEAKALLGSALLFLSAVGSVLAVVCWVAVSHVNFATLFNLTGADTIAAAPAAALAVGLIFCAGFPLGLAQRLAFARQEGWTYNLSQAVGNVVALGVVVFGVHRHWGLAALVAGTQGAIMGANAVLLLAQLAQLRWLSVWRFHFRFSLLRELLSLGAHFGAQQILTTVLFALPQVVISTCLGAAAVTPYNLLQRFYNIFAIVQNAFMLPLWPAYSKAKAKREFAWMRQALRHSVMATVGFSILPMILAACFAHQIVLLWVGHEVPDLTYSLIWLLCAWNSLAFLQQPFSFLLTGVSEVHRTTLYSVASAILSTTLMYLLVRPLGAPGVMLGLILGYLPFNLIGNILETRRYLSVAVAASLASSADPEKEASAPVPSPVSSA